MALSMPPIKAGGTPIEPGTYTAICYGVIDLGKQDATNFNGQPEVQHQVRLLFELPDERLDDGRPKGKSKKCKVSAHEKASLRKAIHALEGRQLTDGEAMAYDLKRLLGRGCNVTIAQGQGEGTYIESFSMLKKREADSLPAPENKTVFYQIEDGRPPESLPDWLCEEILKAHEWRTGPTEAQAREHAPPRRPPAVTAGDDTPDDDIPF